MDPTTRSQQFLAYLNAPVRPDVNKDEIREMIDVLNKRPTENVSQILNKLASKLFPLYIANPFAAESFLARLNNRDFALDAENRIRDHYDRIPVAPQLRCPQTDFDD